MPKVVVIRAMGGQGKTQVALEYCRLWRNTSDIFWIDATSEGTLKANFALLSYVLDPSTNFALETEARVSTVRRALADRKTPWLMVFDNYDDPQSYNIRKFLPDNKLGMVIVTSRHKDSESLADRENRIELKGLDETEAIKLLLLESEMNRSVNISTQHATAIVHRLAYHPLAIAQAGAYISMRNLELENFLDDYNKRQAAILKDTTPLMSDYWKKANESCQEIPMSVFTTCELSYQQLLDLENIEQRNLPDLLTMLAFFDSRDISEALFKAYRRKHGQLHSVTDRYEVHGEIQASAEQRLSKPALAIPCKGPGSFLRQHEGVWDSVSFYEALLVLRRLSLTEFSRPSRKGGSFYVSLHPLIRDWLRLRTPRDQCPEYSSLAATCIYKFLAGTQDWAAYQMTLSEKQQLIRHINAYATNIAEFGVGQHPEAFDIPVYDKGRHKGRPAYEFSKLLYQNGQYKSSAEWSRRSLAQRLQQFGPEASETLATQASLAGALHSQGEHQDANQIYIHIIEVKERTLGSEHPETLLSKMNLAPLLTSQGKYEAAESIYRQVLDSYNKMLGEWDPNTIIARGALGSLLNIIESFKEAEELNRRALTLASIIFGQRHHRTLAIMDFLGVSLTGLDKLEEAEIILQDALRFREQVSGKEHPDTIICMNHLVPVLYWQGKYAAAREVQVRILGAENTTSRTTTAQSTEGIYSYFPAGGFRRDMVYGLYTSMDSAGGITIRHIYHPILGSTVDSVIIPPSTTQA
jgi:tetratricopeptide (TPR) repeat protein